jgi:uncharacterized protein (DUF58 family)
MPSLSAAKDVRGHSVFRSANARWIWKMLTWRLTSAGRWLLIPTLLLFAYTLTSLSWQAFIPFCYIVALWAIALAAPWVYRPRVEVAIRHAQSVIAGEVMPVEIEVEQLGATVGRDLHVLAHGLPDSVDALEHDGLPLPLLKRGDKVSVTLGLVCAHRGVLEMNGFRVETDFPFGLWRSFEVFRREHRLVVFPRFCELEFLDLPLGRRYQPGGVALAAAVGDSMEFVGNREYRHGDSVRNIDWRATARLRKPIVREFREEYLLRAAVVLDTHLPRWPSAAARAAFESAISLCASVSDHLARRECVIDFLAAGTSLYKIQAGRHLAFLDQILEILACVDSDPRTGFETLEPELSAQLPSISSVVCIFLDWNAARRQFVQGLRDHGVGVKIAIVRNAPCTEAPHDDEAGLGTIHVFSSAEVNAGLGRF